MPLLLSDNIKELGELYQLKIQIVLKEAEELRQYYEERNRNLIARIAAQPPKPGTEAAWEKLRAIKAKRESKV